MINLRIVRRDRGEHLLAECQSHVVPTRGELIQLDTLDGHGRSDGPSTLWKVVAVTVHVPSLHSSTPLTGAPLCVRTVEVAVLPDTSLIPDLLHESESILSESRM